MRQKRGKPGRTRSEELPSLDKARNQVVGAPVVVVYKAKKGKKRGSSQASRRLEDIEDRVSKSMRRVSKAVNRGVGTYRDKRDKSARKRRDGALLDSYENAAVGVSEALADSSPVLSDIAKAVNTKRLRKRLRKAIRGIPVIG